MRFINLADTVPQDIFGIKDDWAMGGDDFRNFGKFTNPQPKKAKPSEVENEPRHGLESDVYANLKKWFQ